MNPRDQLSRLSVVEDRTQANSAEIQRLRERMHLLEGDRSAIRLAVGQLNRLRHDIPEMAHRVAEETIAAALANRDQLHKQKAIDRRSGLGFRAQLVFGAAGLISVLVLLYDRFL